MKNISTFINNSTEMKNYILFFVLVLISVHTKAQFEIGVSGGMGINHRSIKNIYPNEYNYYEYYLFVEDKSFKTSIQYSGNLLYKFNKKFAIETGVEFQNRGYSRKDWKVKYQYVDNNNTPQVYDVTVNQNFQFKSIAIPLMFNYYIGNNRLNYFISVGANLQSIMEFNIRNKEKFSNGTELDYNLKQKLPFNRLNIAPMLRFGVNYQLNQKYYLRLSTDFRHDTYSIIDDGLPYKMYLYDLNTSIGIFYKFR